MANEHLILKKNQLLLLPLVRAILEAPAYLAVYLATGIIDKSQTHQYTVYVIISELFQPLCQEMINEAILHLSVIQHHTEELQRKPTTKLCQQWENNESIEN